MSHNFEKSVKGATKIKLAAPKSKYIENILVATHTGEAGVAEIFRTLHIRLRESTWTVVFKALIVIHLMIREGQLDATLQFISDNPSKIAISQFSEAQSQGHNIRRYSDYILARARAFEDTKTDYVRSGQGRMRRLKVDKGLLRETEMVQKQIWSLLRCDLLMDDVENEITLTAFRLLVLDLMTLYAVMNEGTINVLEHYFEMSRPDSERALEIYKTFTSQTEEVVAYLGVARRFEAATRLEIPKLKHASTDLTRLLEDDLNDPDFDLRRSEYLAQKHPGRGRTSSYGGGSRPAPSPKTTSNRPQTAPKPEKKPDPPELIDFFGSIEEPATQENQLRQQQLQQQQNLAFQQAGFQPQQTGFQPQQTGFYQQQTGFHQPQQTGFQQPQPTGFQQSAFGGFPQQSQFGQPQVPQPLQPTPTGAGFGGYTAQTQSYGYQNNLAPIPQSNVASFPPQQQPQQPQQPQQLQPQPTNPFRQSMMMSMPTGSAPSMPQSAPSAALNRQSTNPFARRLSSVNLEAPPQAPAPVPVQTQPLQPQRTGTNPFSRSSSVPPQAQQQGLQPPAAAPLRPNPTGSTNPFRQSAFVNQQTGQGWQSFAAESPPTCPNDEHPPRSPTYVNPSRPAHAMDTQNLRQPPAERSFAAGHHEQILPMLAKPAAWASAPPPTSGTMATTAATGTGTAAVHPTSPFPITSPGQNTPSPVEVEGNRPFYGGSSQQNQNPNPNGVTKLRKQQPRKGNNASGGRSSSLFWVHTDPQSASEGTREETLKRIRSHVMSEHNRKKRENTKRYTSKTWKHLAFQPVETTATTAAGIPTTTNNTTTTKSTSPPAGPLSRSPVHSATSRSTKSPESPEIVKSEEPETRQNEFVASPTGLETGSTGIMTPVQNPQPWSYLGQGALDPFSMTHTPLSARMMRHLQNFLCNLARQAYPLQHRTGPKLEAHWASLVRKDPASLHACICVAASSMALQTGEFPLIEPSKQGSSVLVLDTFHHRGETIRLVNDGLSDPVKAASDELIAAVSILLTIEIASGNPDYLKIHLAGLRQMVALRNSFADVPPDVRFQISWTDIRVACMAFTKPIFPFLRSTRPSTLSIPPPHEELAGLASGLVSLVEIPDIFDEDMCRTIYDLRELTWYAEWIKSEVGEHTFDEATEDYFNNEVLHVEYSLHKDRYTPTGQVKGDASIEGCVRLACLLFHNTAIWDFYPLMAPVFPKPIIALRMALEATIPTGCYNLCRDLLIWLLFVGACATSSSPQTSKERTFFVSGLATTVQGVQSWQSLRGLLLRFFYVDRRYFRALRGLWEEIQPNPNPQLV